MTRGLRIDFRFVPFPQEIWREGLDLTESEFKLLGYLLYHQARFGQSIIALSDDEMLKGRKHNGERVDRGCGIKGRNNLKSARQKLIERGWVDCEQDRFGTKYKIELCEIMDQVSKTDTAISNLDTLEGVQNGQYKRPKQTPKTSKTDTPNKEEEELYIEQNKRGGLPTEDLPAISFAQRVVEELCLGHEPGTLHAAAGAINFCVRYEGKTKSSATEYLIASARDEIDRGGAPNRFWFTDRKWRNGSSNGNGHSKAQRVQDSSLDAIQTAVSRINGRAAGTTESGLPKPERHTRDGGVVLDGTGGDPPRGRTTAPGNGPDRGNA